MRVYTKPTTANKIDLVTYANDSRLKPTTRGLIRLYLAKVLPDEYAPDQAEIAALLQQVQAEIAVAK